MDLMNLTEMMRAEFERLAEKIAELDEKIVASYS